MNKEKKSGGISEDALAAEYEAVYRYVLSLCRNDSTAQDITQEAFLKAMRSASQFQGNSSLYTWLCAIAKNHWLNLCRTGSRELPLTDPACHETTTGSTLEEILIEKDTAILFSPTRISPKALSIKKAHGHLGQPISMRLLRC